MKKLLVVFFVLSYGQNYGQTLDFDFVWNDAKIVLGEDYEIPQQGDMVRFSKIKCYISNIQFLVDGIIIDSLYKKHHLLDLSNPPSLQFNSSQKSFDAIQFTLGVDSLTNAAGVMGGDLDPTEGMYWTWQSGYINVKIEGESKQCGGRKNRFQFHLGGFRNNDNCEQQIQISIPNQQINTNIQIDLYQLFLQIDLSKQFQIMSPGLEAKQQTSKMAKVIKLNI